MNYSNIVCFISIYIEMAVAYMCIWTSSCTQDTKFRFYWTHVTNLMEGNFSQAQAVENRQKYLLKF